ncbi:MAG: hypothetical protein LH468_03910 [Nocardioides sp.]|nr:hypothetical protein [Nocardioides sp.]
MIALLGLLSACGGDESEPSAAESSSTPPEDTESASPSEDTESASPSPSAEPGYFVSEDTDRMNGALAAFDPLMKMAVAPKRLNECNRVAEEVGYAPWRTCLHALIDPLIANLDDVAAAIRASDRASINPECSTAVEVAATFFDSEHAGLIGLMKGFDSDDRAAQARSAGKLAATLLKLQRGINKPLTDLSQLCYSPEDLATITPSASPAG